MARILRKPAVWRPMTAEERAACLAMSPGKINYPIASSHRRLANNLNSQALAQREDGPQITDRQVEALWKMVYRYRRQVTDRALMILALRAVTPKHEDLK